MYIDRKKAWLGAAIGAVGGIVGGLIGGRKQRKAQRAMLRAQQYEANRNASIENSNALEQAYADQSYVDDYNDRLAFSYGGKRKKCVAGAEEPIDDNVVDGSVKDNTMTSDLGSGIVSGVGSVISGLMTSSTPVGTVTKPTASVFATKSNTKPIVNGNIDIYGDRLKSVNHLRCGGKRMKH